MKTIDDKIKEQNELIYEFELESRLLDINIKPTIMYNKDMVTRIYFDEIPQEVIPESTFKFPHLKEIKIVNPTEKVVEQIIRHQKDKKIKIDFKYNNKDISLPEETIELVNLTGLDLSYNRLVSLPEGLENLVYLERLNFGINELTEIPESIGNLVNLEMLDLRDNNLIKLPKSVGKLVNLQMLYLWNNQLSEIPESFGKLVNLWELGLENNSQLGEYQVNLLGKDKTQEFLKNL